MKDEEITEGNKLIAEFMGGSYTDTFHAAPKEIPVFAMYANEVGSLKYHCSWDWLMPVVEKIERLEAGYSVYIFDNHCKIWPAGSAINLPPIVSGWSGNIEDSDKIHGVYQVVVEFIKWYNQNDRQEQKI